MEKLTVGTPYDDVFRTLMNDCTGLPIPIVNEVFGENYTGKEEVEFLPNEHFISPPGTDTKEKITDSCFRIRGTKDKKYHIECQSTADNNMTIRMFEYDSQIALDDGEIVNGKLIVTFPHSAVVYLRHNARTPDALTVEINTPGGSISYRVPVMKTQTYTIKDIFDRNLLFLIPFYIFSHESRFKEYETDEEKLRQLCSEYESILKRLTDLCEAGEISEYVKCTLVDMSKKVIENIAMKYANVKKGVTSIMGGKILEYEAKTILQDGIRKGKLEGELDGIRKGKIEGRLQSLVELVKDGLLSVSEAAKRLSMSEEELKKYL